MDIKRRISFCINQWICNHSNYI